MANRITWLPSTETDILAYRIETATSQAGTYAEVTTITHNLTGPYYDSAAGCFFYEDPAGGTSTWYRLISIDTANNESAPSTPFQAVDGGALTLASLNDLKAYLAIDHNKDDAVLTRLLQAASKWFESQIAKPVSVSLYSEVFSGDGSRVYVPKYYPVQSVSSVTIDGEAITESASYADYGWVLLNGSIHLRGYRYSKGVGNVTVVYSAGETSIPSDIQQAVIEVAADRFRARSRIGELSKSIGGENVSFVSFQVPVSVKTVIDTYQRVGF